MVSSHRSHLLLFTTQAVSELMETRLRIEAGDLVLPTTTKPEAEPQGASVKPQKAGTGRGAKRSDRRLRDNRAAVAPAAPSAGGRKVSLSSREQMLLAAAQAAEALAKVDVAHRGGHEAASSLRRAAVSAAAAQASRGGGLLIGGGKRQAAVRQADEDARSSALMRDVVAGLDRAAEDQGQALGVNVARIKVLRGLARLGELRQAYDEAARCVGGLRHRHQSIRRFSL